MIRAGDPLIAWAPERAGRRRIVNPDSTTPPHSAFSFRMSTPNTNSSPYYAMIRTADSKFALRHNLVLPALQHGLRATAAHFGCADGYPPGVIEGGQSESERGKIAS